MARKKFNENLEQLMNMEMMFSQARPELKKSKEEVKKKEAIKL